MYHVIKKDKTRKQKGFTLVELLIAIAIIGTISVISVQLLYDIVSIRAKQQTIEDSSDSFRIVSRLISKSIMEARYISIQDTGTSVQIIQDESCQTISYNLENSSIRYKSTDSTSCANIASLTADDNITSNDLIITKFLLSQLDEKARVILFEMEGYYKNSLGNHPINYTTTITRRI